MINEAGSTHRSEQVPSAVLAIVAAMLIAGAFKWPYEYYTLLRLIVFGSAAFEGLSGLSADMKNAVAWIAICIALLFNPVIPVHLHKADWQPIDIVVGLCYAVLAFVRFRSEKQAEPKT